jgi:DNA mismatch repair protein MutS2
MGFCPAEKARLSDFGYIRTSMDIKGSIDREESLFAAQCKLLGEIDSDVQNLPKTTHSFVALDEPCSQTNPKQGSALAMAIGAKLSKVKGNMTIITHFRNIAETIGDKSDSVDGKLSYKNYKMERGGTFKLAPGISEESANNAFEVAKQFGMESQIVEEAKDYVRDV